MKTLCIIPARGGSKGLPRKNVALLAGKPLVCWPVLAAQMSGVIDTVFVSTDDQEIAEAAQSVGAEVPFLRDSDLALDTTTTEETLKQALLSFEDHKNTRYDIAVFLTCTDVFRDPNWIEQAVTALKKNPELESAFSVCETHKNYWHEVQGGQFERILPWMKTYSNRQVRKKIYREDTGLACASRAQLWRDGLRIGDRVQLIVNDLSETSIDVHTAFDLFLAEQTIRYWQQHDPSRVKVFNGAL